MKTDWVEYKNGNYTVHLNLVDGTKIRENKLDFFEAEFPESADVKITNRCCDPLGFTADGESRGNCKFCHEGSSPVGEHSDAVNSPIWDSFHSYTEIALGGGNVLEYPDLIPLLKKLKKLKLIANITVHQNHFMAAYPFVKGLVDHGLVHGVGISLYNPLEPHFIERVQTIPNAVIHVINGVVTTPELDFLSGHGLKILILGYKEVRRGEKYYSSKFGKPRVEGLKENLYNYLPSMVGMGYVKDRKFDVVSFDNLAIAQLNPDRLIPKEVWNRIYMGSDGINNEQISSASMYFDLVENIYSRNSCDVYNRRPIRDKTVTEMYQSLKDNASFNEQFGVFKDKNSNTIHIEDDDY